MKKGITIGALSILLIAGCNAQTKAGDGATYIESADEYNTFEAIKLVDEETGCKFLVVRGEGSHNPVVTQMLNPHGKPNCN